MSIKPRILAFAGSTRRESFNKRLVPIASAGAEAAGAEVTIIDLRDYPLPLYDGDLEAAKGVPENGLKLKQIFLDHHGLLVACPEYNGSISAVLKNTIDWVSRPQPDTAPLACFKGKAVTLMSASPGALGGLRGLVHVRTILAGIGCIVLPEQRSINHAHEAFDETGQLRDPTLHSEIEQLGAQLATLVQKLF